MSSSINQEQKSGRDTLSAPGFWRRLAAQVYDLLLLIAVLFLATALLLPLTAGMAVNDHQVLIYRLYLVTISFLFYGWFWTHGGQTLGLRAWKLTVLTKDQKTLNWTQALVRFATASIALGFFGLGFLWILIDKDRRGWSRRGPGCWKRSPRLPAVSSLSATKSAGASCPSTILRAVSPTSRAG